MSKITISIILFSIILTPCLTLAQEQKEMSKPLQLMWNWIREKTLFVYNKIYFLLSKEVEHRKPGVEDEFKKETEEIKQEVKQEAPSLWQRFLDLIK